MSVMKMGRVLLTEENLIELRKNKYVLEANEIRIIYSNEFKRYFIEQYQNGVLPKQIFRNAGFDPKMLGAKRIERCTARWRIQTNGGKIDIPMDIKENWTAKKKKTKAVNRKIRNQQLKIERLLKENDLLKKVDRIERRREKKSEGILPNKELFPLIESFIIENDLSGMTRDILRCLSIPKSTYYDWIKNKQKRETIKRTNDFYLSLIKDVYAYRGFKKGSRTIKYLLKRDYGVVLSRKKIQKIMRENNILCPIRKANPYRQMWKATKEDKISPNLLERHFKSGLNGKVLLTDITYIFYGHDRLAYLSAILDAESKEIMAYCLKQSLKLPIVLETLDMLERSKLAADCLIHSDQGVHYTSKNYREKVIAMGLKQSMSRRGNCWDNAPMESFFGHMKDEVDFKHIYSYEELILTIDSYINYYNYDRPQESLGNVPPMVYGINLDNLNGRNIIQSGL